MSRFCEVCDTALDRGQKRFCSRECMSGNMAQDPAERPTERCAALEGFKPLRVYSHAEGVKTDRLAEYWTEQTLSFRRQHGTGRKKRAQS